MSGSSRSPGCGPLGPEFELIERLAEHLPRGSNLPPEAAEYLKIGIGDDAAVWELPSGEQGILTIDTVVEGVHAFTHEPPEAVGARALTAAVSDVAAMGGHPLLALVALQAPKATSEGHLVRIYDGVSEEAGVLGVAVVGGDVVDTPGPLALTVAVYGVGGGGSVWTRGGASPGDAVAVSGNLGGSRAGVELLGLGEAAPDTEWSRRLMERHLRPRARVKTARALAELGGVKAAIDISDGLSSESWHLALGSGVEVHLRADAIPLHPDLIEHMAWRRSGSAPAGDEEQAAVDFALDSGEEYELLIALPRGHPALSGGDLGGEGPLTVIGDVVEGVPEVMLHGPGWSRSIKPGGYTHRKTGEQP